MPQDPIQVYENHSGPIPQGRNALGSRHLHFRFVAYRDAEADAPFYGYGDTEENAIADYVRQQAEAYCDGCGEGNPQACRTSDECILTSGEAAHQVKVEIETWRASQSNTHAIWRELNK